MRRHIHFVAQFAGSIDVVTKGLIDGLSNDYIVTREGYEEPEEYDILICHFIQPSITKSSAFEKFRYKILIQPIDGTSIRRDIVKEFNKFDTIVTPAKAGKKILEQNGVKVPIEVISNFITIRFTDVVKLPKKLTKQLKGKFVFYHESTCHPRKGVDIMLKAYVREFSTGEKEPEVIMLLKTPEHNPVTFEALEKLKKEIANIQKVYPYPARIIKISQHLTKDQLGALMYWCDCYVQPSKIEGFGIPVLNAVAANKFIVAAYSELNGYMDFLPTPNTILVRGKKEIAIGEINPMYTEVSEWCVPDEKLLGTAMRKTTTLLKQDQKNLNLQIRRHTIGYVVFSYKELLKQPLFDSKYKFIESDVILK